MDPRRLPVVLLCILVLTVVACDDDDDSDPVGPGGDTTAPVVSSTTPGTADGDVGPDDDVVVVFDEDMDVTTADGNVTLSTGTITGLTWDDDRTLRIAHTTWSPGERVEVTIGTGLTDDAGNGLAVPFTLVFWVASTEVLLLETQPADGATGVSRDVVVNLRFNRDMDLTSLAAATSATVVGGAPLAFTLSGSSDDTVHLRFAAELPPNTDVEVTITTAAMATGGQPLATPISLTFTTGPTSDLGPPTSQSAAPANGTVIGTNTSSVVSTFSGDGRPSS